jgi:hypothetical protein
VAGIWQCLARSNTFIQFVISRTMANTSLIPLIDRFPHLQREIQRLFAHDSGFRQLNEDYELLLRSLVDSSQDDGGDREELVSLKTTLEAEALERLSRVNVWSRSHG